MGCSGCGGGSFNYIQSVFVSNNSLEENPGPCDYTIDQLYTWRDKLICVKENLYFKDYNLEASDINKHLGNVISAINYNTSLCFFKKELALVAPLIEQINASGKC